MINKLPDHKCSLTIVHNDHKNIYQSAEEWIEENTFCQWISEEEKKKERKRNETKREEK